MPGTLDLVDTHCHIHEIVAANAQDDVHRRWRQAGVSDADAVLAAARQAGVRRLLCVGTDVDDSVLAVDFVQPQPMAWASIGIHPHEAKRYAADDAALRRFAGLAARPKVVAVGECGLDFYYSHSPRADQERLLRYQLELALAHSLPLVFHVREAFREFWPIFDEFRGLRGVVHSFTADRTTLDEVLARGLFVGLNGIMTFTKDAEQLAAAKAVPSDRLLLETDAPFLTPSPYRGKVCEPKHVRATLEFLAALREEDAHSLAAATTTNARQLFGLR